MPNDADARSALHTIDETRRRAVEFVARPRWLDALVALLLGVTVGAFVSQRGWAAWLVAVLAFAVSIALSIWVRSRAGRHGQLNDDRAVTARMGRTLLAYIPIFLITLVRPEPPVAWWLVAVLGLGVAAIAFVTFRWEQDYEAKRIRSGDYGPYDIA